ncbi:cupin domain-containing protein [Micromonospora sp. NPDC050495]|uniref:cupin domain-containing protein n=1 Tax=Micromonospora sp. NPDC050495 TaxID=3154936 RepID=UPI0033D5AD0A
MPVLRRISVHDDTDEFFLVLDGELHISLREPAGERTVLLAQGAVFTVPRGTEHKPSLRPVQPSLCSSPPEHRQSAIATTRSRTTWTQRSGTHLTPELTGFGGTFQGRSARHRGGSFTGLPGGSCQVLIPARRTP